MAIDLRQPLVQFISNAPKVSNVGPVQPAVNTPTASTPKQQFQSNLSQNSSATSPAPPITSSQTPMQTFGFGGDPGKGIAPTSVYNYDPSTGQTSQAQAPKPSSQPTLPTESKDNESYIRNLANSYFESFKPSAGLESAYKSYTESLQPSADVTAAKQQYLNTLADRDKLIAGMEGQGRGIPLGLIRGQQARSYGQFAPELQRLQGGVDIAQSSSEQSQKANLEKLRYEQFLAEQGQSGNKARLDFESSLSKMYEPTTLAAGSSLVDPKTGKVIYQAPYKPEGVDYPASYREYLLTTNNPTAEGFDNWLTYDANRKRSITSVNAGGNGLTPYQELNAILNIQGKLSTQTSDARDAVGRYSQAQTAWTQYQNKQLTKNAVEQIIVNNFNKILDPTSVVREGEYARSAQGQSLINNLYGKYSKIAQGGNISDSELKGFLDGVGILVQRYQQEIDAKNKQALATANQFGLPSDLIGANSGASQSNVNLNDLF